MRYLLFTTTQCPKCPEVKTFVADSVPFVGDILDETTPDFMSQAGEYGITAAPVFLVFDDADQEVFRGEEVSQIQDFLSS